MGPRFLWEHDPGREPRGGAGWLWDPGLLGWSLPMAGAHPEPGLGTGSRGGADRPLLQGDGAGGSRDWLLSPLLCGALGTQCLAGRQAGSSLRALPAVLAALRDTRHHPQTLIHHSLHRPTPGMEKSPAPEGPGSTGSDKTHLRLLLPAASPELGCDHDRSAGCQGPALLLLPRGDTSPQVPFIPPTHRGMSVGGGGSLACPRPPVVTFGDFLLKDQWHRG